MLKGFNENGDLKNLKVDENGALIVAMEGGGGGTSQDVEVKNTTENPVPVDIQNQNIIVGNNSQNPIPVNIQGEVETTINASVQTVGTTASSIAINKKVTSIDVANYSETANVTLSVGTLNAVIGSNIATTLVINDDVTNIGLQSTEADTTVQIIVKGVV